MHSELVDESRPWVVSDGERPPALEVVLPKETVVLAWSQFVFAEGGDEEVRIAFASHDVVVLGAGLGVLLRAISGQRVRSIAVQSRAERFSGGGGRFVREIAVRRIDAA
ncbi:MAG: hypothetical protein R2729_23390 [Bryobacteraceae bacterium]